MKRVIKEWLIVKIYEFGTSSKRSQAFREGFDRNVGPNVKTIYETIKLNKRLRK